ncbi:hypothetical protein SELMODRAFT_271350 [Selaginella moellendorffii]|uniref:Peroxidase n=1 Tax=Selaginella moellendorffii TaxID=88036 RepID=D8S6W2_SELML|nr:cationic peroxidase 1 [Selaginella moellendorffii]EFJ20004.1 hypothetical protein SELMODRAFT_271350 [Selaginella moellendorffii]|eukprot:XP_002979047.1 cationic peroxidase 1 [Selaginella moellendorffii]
MISTYSLLLLLIATSSLAFSAEAALATGYYDSTCPQVEKIVRAGVANAAQSDSRLPASLLRLHFHDCFVQGCDASVLLDDTPTFQGEKTAGPNNNSIRGFEAIDAIKSSLESSCKGVVSCADILALAARDSVVLSGGPSWEVPLGRRDSITASFSGATNRLPSFFSDVNGLIKSFTDVGLTAEDMFTLSGGHSIGQARCLAFVTRIFNDSGSGSPDPSIRPSFLSALQSKCPQTGSLSSLQPLDATTITKFDNQYYLNLVLGKGLLHSDQVLFNTVGVARNFVKAYSADQSKFFSNFAGSMIKMGKLSPLLAPKGIIRSNCRVPR